MTRRIGSVVIEQITESYGQPSCARQGGDSYMEETGMLAVSLMGVKAGSHMIAPIVSIAFCHFKKFSCDRGDYMRTLHRRSLTSVAISWGGHLDRPCSIVLASLSLLRCKTVITEKIVDREFCSFIKGCRGSGVRRLSYLLTRFWFCCHSFNGRLFKSCNAQDPNTSRNKVHKYWHVWLGSLPCSRRRKNSDPLWRRRGKL